MCLPTVYQSDLQLIFYSSAGLGTFTRVAGDGLTAVRALQDVTEKEKAFVAQPKDEFTLPRSAR